MSIWWTVVTVLLLILPALSQVITTTCEIPSVEAGDDATLSVHFGEDLTQKQERDFILAHLDRNQKETGMLSCEFSNGDVKCDKTPCCTWESKVTDVFRVYIHNASQQLEGKFWGFVIPADTEYQKYCNFTLKASTCPIDPINAANSHVACNNQSVTIGQSCTVTCNSGHYFQENQTSVTYTCVGRNKWSPEIPVTSCKVHPKDQNLYFLFLLLSALPIVTVVVILFKRRHKEKTQRKSKEDPLLSLTSAELECGYMMSKRPNIPQVNVDEASEINVVEQKVEITLKKTESVNQDNSQTINKSPLTFKGVDCIKTASRSTPIKTDVGTVQLETIPDFKTIMQAAEKIALARIDWSKDRIQKLESETMEMKVYEEKNKAKIMKLEKDIRVTRQLEDNTWMFHNNCRSNIVLSSNGQTAQVKDINHWKNRMLISRDPLSTNKLYEILLEKTDTQYNAEYIGIGICEENPLSATLLTECFQMSTFVGVHPLGSRRYNQGTNKVSCPALRTVKDGSRIGVMVDTSHSLHVYVDGKDQGVMANNVAQQCYAVFDLRYLLKKASTLPLSSIH